VQRIEPGGRMITRREIETKGVGHKSSNSAIPTLKTRSSPKAPSSNPHSLYWDKRPIHKIKPQMRVQHRRRVQTYRSRRLQALREQLDTLQPKALARSIRIALDDDGLGMLRARQPHIIPARIANTEPATRPKCINRPGNPSQVKSRMTTLELFGLPATIPFSSCVCVEPWLM